MAPSVFAVENLDALQLQEESCGYVNLLVSRSNPLAEDAIFKCSDVSPSEVFGYLLAELLAVPVPKWLPVRLCNRTELPDGYVAAANHLAILVQRLSEVRPIQLDDVATVDDGLAARILTLCLFDRFEWPEVLDTTDGVFVVDLERIGPVMCLDEFKSGGSTLEISTALAYREREYTSGSNSAIAQTLLEAKRLSVLAAFKRNFSRVSDESPRLLTTGLRIEDHPLSQHLSSFFGMCISGRQTHLAERWGVTSWSCPDWRRKIRGTQDQPLLCDA